MEGFVEVLIRSGIVYLFIIFGIRIFGKKEISQLSVIDLVFILLISNAVQNAMVGENTSLAGGLIAALTLFLLNYLFKNLFYRSKRISGWIQGEPLMLVYHGKVVPEHMAKAKISMAELEASVREHGVEEVSEVDLAVLEVDGNISVLSDKFKRITTKKRHAHKVISSSL